MIEEDLIYELVVYKIKPNKTEKYATEIIDFFRKKVMSFEGFRTYKFFQSCRDSHTFMDLVLWESLEFAECAAKKVKEIQKGDDFIEYIESFEKVEIFNHFKNIESWEKD